MKKYCLLKGVVDYLHTLVYTQPLERCSILYVADHKNDIDYLEYDPTKENIGIEEGGRQRCDSEDYHHIVHTHPKSEYSYPSVEDIWRLVKEPAIKLSVIATSWGIYTLKQKEEFKGLDWLNDLKANHFEQGFKDWLNGILDDIGKLQDKKRARNRNDHTLTPDEYMKVNVFLSYINSKMDIEIKLIPWLYIKFSPT